MAFTIPQAFKDRYVLAVDEIIRYFSVNTVIHYPPLREECENCIRVGMQGVSASNVYKTGGPYPFTDGVCPYCNGLNYREIPATETIKLRAYFDKKSWKNINIPIGIKDGSVWTIGKMEDLIKVQRAAYITLPSNIITPLAYTLYGEPIPWGISKDRYFSAFWERGE